MTYGPLLGNVKKKARRTITKAAITIAANATIPSARGANMLLVERVEAVDHSWAGT